MLAVCYVARERVLQLPCLRFPSAASKDLEIVVLRQELAVLRRHVQRPAFRPADRLFLAAASRILSKRICLPSRFPPTSCPHSGGGRLLNLTSPVAFESVVRDFLRQRAQTRSETGPSSADRVVASKGLQLLDGHRVVATPVLGGLHHESRLEAAA